MKNNLVLRVAVCLFLINLVGYTVFRSFIANDLTGGDATNMAQAKPMSYILSLENIGDRTFFFQELLKGRDNPKPNTLGALYQYFSYDGRKAIEKYASGTGDEHDRELFNYELNSRILDHDHFRKQTYKIFKDSPSPELHSLADRFNKASNFVGVVKNLKSFLPPEGQRYLMLTHLYIPIIQSYLQDNPEKVFPVIVLNGILYAILMAVLFLLAWEMLGSIPWALIAVLIYQSSPATIKASFNLFCMPYLFVPLFMVVGLYGYVRYKSSGEKGWFVLFAVFAFMSPWIREFAGAVPYIVFASELLVFRSKRSAWLMALCLPLMAHSFYPSLLPGLLGLYKGHILSAFSSGHANQFINQNLWPIWHMYALLFSQIAPSLWIILALAVALWLWCVLAPTTNKVFTVPLLHKQISFVLPIPLRASIVLRVGSLLILGAIIYKFSISYFVANADLERGVDVQKGTALILPFLVLTVLSLRFNAFLSVFFIAMAIPFIRIELGDIHFSFTLPPLVILFSLWTRDAFNSVTTIFAPQRRGFFLIVLLVLLGIGLTDQLMNMPASALTQHRLAKGNMRIAEAIRASLPKHSIVIGNSFSVTDIYYYSKYHFDAFEARRYNYLSASKAIADSDALSNLMRNNKGVRDIYFLAADHPLYSFQVVFHSHRFVKENRGNLTKLSGFTLGGIYYYLDPIKYFVPRIFIPQAGYQDWESDFYFNNLAVPFRRIQYADFALYKMEN